MSDFKNAKNPPDVDLKLPGLLQNQNLEIILFCIVVLCYPHNNIA